MTLSRPLCLPSLVLLPGPLGAVDAWAQYNRPLTNNSSQSLTVNLPSTFWGMTPSTCPPHTTTCSVWSYGSVPMVVTPTGSPAVMWSFTARNCDGCSKTADWSYTNTDAGEDVNEFSSLAVSDPAGVVSLSISPATIGENGGTSTVTESRSGAPSSSPTDVQIDIHGGTATLSEPPGGFDDFAQSGTAVWNSELQRHVYQITIPANQTTESVTLTAVQDTLDEPDETVVVDITGVTNAVENGTQQVTATITDDDSPPSVSLSLTGSPFSETGGSATVTAPLGAVSGKDVTVNLGFTGTATNGTDYTRSADSIKIPAGQPSGSITLSSVSDTIDDDDPSGLAFATQPATTTIGAALSPVVTVQVVDSSGRPVGSAASVTLALGANPGGATLAGTTTTSAVAGVASFGDLSLDACGVGYTLVAISPGLASTTSDPLGVKQAVTTFSGPTATGTGTVTASFVGGGAACSFVLAELLPAPPGVDPVPPRGLPGFLFPHGLFRFELENCRPGSTVTFTVTYPQPLSEGTPYWMYGPPSHGAPSSWYRMPASVDGATATFDIVDGGPGDADGLPDGKVLDPGGPTIPDPAASGEIPALSGWGLRLLALLLAGLGLLRIRR